jgi:hypothetical protein
MDSSQYKDVLLADVLSCTSTRSWLIDDDLARVDDGLMIEQPTG